MYDTYLVSVYNNGLIKPHNTAFKFKN